MSAPCRRPNPADGSHAAAGWIGRILRFGRRPARKAGIPQRSLRVAACPLLLCLLVVLLSACLPRAITTPSESVYASPQAALQAISALPPAAALSARARIRMQHRDHPFSLRVALLIRKPASLRLESIPLMGPPDFFLSIADGELRAFLPQEGGGRFYTGPATPENLTRFFPLALPPPAMVSLLLGEAGDEVQRPDPDSFLRGEQENNLYRIDQYRHGQPLRSLWIDPDRHRLVRLRLFQEGGEGIFTVEYKDHILSESAYLPQEISVSHDTLPGMTIRLSDMQRIAGEASDFILPLPAGVIPLRLD